MKTKHITITEEITIKEIVLIAREKYKVQLAKQLLDKIHESRKLVNNFIHHDQIVYGVTTGVGDNSKIKISSDESQLLQKNIIRSHACGVGEPLKEDQVRAVIVMMIKNLSLGYSGVRYETIQALINLLNCNIVPRVPRDGSLGYLSYQAHISLVLLGEGEAYVNQELLPGNLALQKCGLEAISLHEKEGLSLINGTVDMTSLGALAIYDAQQLLKIADLAGAMSFEALKGNPQAFDARLGKLKPHQGLINTMKNLRALIKDSNIMKEFKNYRVQDALSIRSMPQVHGASKDSLNYIKSTVEIEINAASDNPLLFVDEQLSLSSSNCHGQSVAMVLDFLSISLSEIANISERRIFRLVSNQYSELPPFLVKESGINSGYMIPQYVAASLVSHNKVLSNPAVVDSIPTTANQEDHVSMGTLAALKALNVVENSRRVLAIELMCGAQAMEFLYPFHAGNGINIALKTIRKHIEAFDQDRVIYKDIEKMEELILSEELINMVENSIGELLI